jgi:pimeloyl-ACP methyl ester carboxylesterase
VSDGGLRYESYGPNREWMMRIGPDRPAILFVPPLLEEMNRTRALVAATMRRLAAAGHPCLLPDLQGTGESERPLAEATWEAWRAAIALLAGECVATVAIRGGCLLDDAAGLPAWRLAPVDGASLVRDLERSGLVGGGGAAGYDLDPHLIEALRGANPAASARSRTVRLASDRGDAELKVDGPPLWRRSEPQNSAELADAIASDIMQWVASCAAS